MVKSWLLEMADTLAHSGSGQSGRTAEEVEGEVEVEEERLAAGALGDTRLGTRVLGKQQQLEEEQLEEEEVVATPESVGAAERAAGRAETAAVRHR